MKKLKLTPAQCAMVGDTPYDAESAKHAGVVCLGLTCGGRSPGDLLGAGASRSWRDAADLLAKLDDALHIASPGSAHLTQDLVTKLMARALDVAREGMKAARRRSAQFWRCGDATVIGADSTSSIAPATRQHMRRWLRSRVPREKFQTTRDLILVSTLEPCVMCLGAAMEAAVDTIIYGLKAPADSGTARVMPPQSPESGMPRILGGILAQESRTLFEQWLKQPGLNPQQVKFVKQLLKLTKDER